MTDRGDQPKDPATSSSQPHSTQIQVLHLKSFALTLRHDYAAADFQPENTAGVQLENAAGVQPENAADVRRRKRLAFKLLNTSGTFKSRRRL